MPYILFYIYEQFIKIMAKQLINTIVKELKSSIYYSNNINSKSNISDIDQFSFVMWWVKMIGEPGE